MPPRKPAKPDNLTTVSTRARVTPRLGGPLSDEERANAQEAFLGVFARTGNVSQAARRARISRETYYQWRETDEAFRARLSYADEDAQDALRKETFRRSVLGVPEPITNAQGLVYEYEPVIGADGEPELDSRGRQKMKRGKAVTVKKYSDALLAKMLSARVPEYRDKKQIEVTGKDGGPIQTKSEREVSLRPEDLDDDDLDAFLAMLERAQARKQAQGGAHGVLDNYK